MDFLADTHVHLYPGHDLPALLDGAVANLRRHAGTADAPCILFLTEGQSFHVFDELFSGKRELPASHRLEPAPESGGAYVYHEGTRTLLIAGRQIVCAERIEILALCTEKVIEDGQPASDVIAAVDAAGGVPVLAWAPGKWMFSRAEVVDRIIRHHGDVLRLGDSSLRCTGWPLPNPMAQPAVPVLAGSDPLPFPGDEPIAGTYGNRISLPFDESAPVSSVRRALREKTTPISIIGRRNTPVQMFKRLATHRKHKSV